MSRSRTRRFAMSTPFRIDRRRPPATLAVAALVCAALAGSSARAQTRAEVEPDASRSESATAAGSSAVEEAMHAFAAADIELKKRVGELMAFQTEYRRKDADRPALEAKFEVAKKGAMEASEALEKAALIIARGGAPRKSDPNYGEATPVYKNAVRACMAVVASAIKADDPERALEIVEDLERAGAIGGETSDIYLMGASASMLLSRLDEADAYLAKLSSIGGSPDKQQRVDELAEAVREERPKVAEEMAVREKEEAADDLPRVRLQTSKGDIVLELFENEAPNTVANFIHLVEKHFYDGTPFHRVIPEFMAQGGDPKGTGAGGPGYLIPCETGLPGARKHFRGSISMAHAGKDTGGSQFFLTFRPTEHLDGVHTVFGRIIEGWDALAKIQRTQNEQGVPIPGVKPDSIVAAEVIRKRDHAYDPQTLPDSGR